MKTTLKSLFIFLLAAFALSCEPEPVHVDRVSLSTSAKTIVEGDTFKLEAIVSPSNAANTLVLWSTSNADIATVDQEGLVTGIAPGKARITASTDEFGRTAECTITVTAKTVTGISLDKTELSLKEMEKTVITATVTPDSMPVESLVWASSDEEVASVIGGVVLALQAGTATITAKSADGGASAECVLTVTCDVKGVSLTDHNITIKVGAESQLGAVVYPGRATEKSVSWTSSDPTVATVDETGIVKGVASGVAVIEVKTTDGGFTDKCNVVVESNVQSIELNKTSLDMVVKDTEQLTATVLPEGVSNPKVSWTTTNDQVATVDKESGLVTAIGAGDAIICATTEDGGHHAFCSVSVRPNVNSITMSSEKESLFIGATLSLSVELDPAETAEYVKIVWKSSDEKVATVDQSGKVTPVGKGTAVITASTTDGTVYDTCAVTVTQPVTSIKADPPSQILWVGGESGTVTVSVDPEDADDKTFNVSYAKTTFREIVAFRVSGNVISLEPLKASKDIAILNVTPQSRLDDSYLYTSFGVEVRAHVESVSIEGEESRTVNVGQTLQLTAAVAPSDAYYKTVSWSSDNTDVAVVDSQGKVTAKTPGKAVITVTTTDGEKTAMCTVNVAQPVKEITLDKPAITLTEGETGTLKATVKPDDADQEIVWTSSDTKIATVENGTVTAVAPGSATITVSSKAYPEVKVTCKVTVNAKIIHVSSVTLIPKTLELEVGETKDLGPGVTILPANTSEGVSRLLTWTSTSNGIASVGDFGMVTANAAGTATIRCTSKDNPQAYAECVVTVTLPPVPVESITLSETSATMSYGSTLRLEATVSPSDATDKELTWKSSNTSVATVDATGLVTALRKTGTAVITATSVDNPDAVAECSISVVSQIVNPTGISINPRSFSIYIGQTKTIQGTVSPSNATDKTVIWEPAGGAYVIVESVTLSNGVSTATVRGAKPGNTTLTAFTSDKSYQTTARITVSKNEVSYIEVSDPNGIKLRVGEEYTLTAKAIGTDPNHNIEPSYPGLRWSQTGGVVTVINGHVTAINPGSGAITITSTDNPYKSVTVPVTVLDSSAGDNGHEGVGFEDWNF